MKNDIEAARLAVRNAVNLVEDTDESRKRIRALQDNERKLSVYFNDSVFKYRKDLRLISLDILKKQYDVYNDRLYLNMPIDTMAMVLKGQQLLGKMLSFDSLEVGKSYRKKHCIDDYLALTSEVTGDGRIVALLKALFPARYDKEAENKENCRDKRKG